MKNSAHERGCGELERLIGALEAQAGAAGLQTELIDRLREALERREAEAATDRQRERELEELAEHAQDLIVRVDRECRHLYINPAIEEATGRPSRDFAGKSYRDVGGMPLALCEAWEQSVAEVFEKGRAVTFEADYPGRGGSLRYQVRLVPEMGPDGSVRSAVGIARDISEQRLAELALQESHHFIERIVATSPDFIYVYDLVEKRTVYASRELGRMLGYTQQQLQEMGSGMLPTLLHPEDHWLIEALPRQFESLGDDAVIEHEYRIRHAGGEWRWLHDRKTVFSRMEDGRPRQFLGTAQDITDRKLAEEMLRSERQFLRQVIDTVPSLIFVKDWDGRFILVNRAMTECYGAAAEQLLGKTDRDFNPSDEQTAQFQRDDREVMSTRRPKVIPEEEITDANGGERYLSTVKVPLLEEDGSCGRILGVATDITGRKEAEEKLRMTQFVVDHAADEVLWLNREARFVYANEAACRALGYTCQELLKMRVYDIDPAYPAERWRAQWKELRERGSLSFETVHLRKTGETFPVAVTANYLEYGGVEYNCAFVRDITERKRAEESLAQSKRLAEEASKAKDKFLAILSHELRTPLTPVLAVATVLEKDPNLPLAAREELSMIRRNVELEARLIDDLLDMTRIARGKLELRCQVIRLDEVLAHTVQTCAPDIEAKEQHVGLNLTGTHCWVRGDASRIQQIFWNLLKNAIKFTPHRGCIGIFGFNDKQGRIVVDVVDSGIGIDPDVLPRIFDAFEQGGKTITRDFGGLGLGLAIGKALVELHGGTICAESAGKGKGARFRVTLPTVAAPEEEPEKEQPRIACEAAAEAAPEHRLRVLLVEDHEDTARTMSHLLKISGYEVWTADATTSALELASQGAFDLIVSDLGLPDGSGLDLMRQLRQQQPQMKGIALSGFGTDEDIARSREAGFVEHLTKPVSFDRFREAIVQLIGKPAARDRRGE